VGQAADELRSDIEHTREDLAATMDAIGDRISPRLQAQRQAERLRQSGVEPARMAMAAAVVMLGLLLIRRRRHARRAG
jgi:Protein of unknown function (DUF3618)